MKYNKQQVQEPMNEGTASKEQEELCVFVCNILLVKRAAGEQWRLREAASKRLWSAALQLSLFGKE